MGEIARRTFLRLAALAAGVLVVRPALAAVRAMAPAREPLRPGEMIVRRSIDHVELRTAMPGDARELAAFAAGGDVFLVAIYPSRMPSEMGQPVAAMQPRLALESPDHGRAWPACDGPGHLIGPGPSTALPAHDQVGRMVGSYWVTSSPITRS